jgi:subtilase family serine protease
MSRSLRRSTVPMLVAAAAVLLAPAAHATTTHVRVGAAPVLPRSTQVGAAVAATKQLQLTVALQPQDPAALEAFATAVATPSSPLYHQYLSVPQFAQRFGATPAQVSAVQSALRAQGLTVGAPSANDLSLPVTATAAQAERAFSVSLAQVKTPSGRSAYANDQAPAVPAGVAPYVQGVIGLDDVTVNQPQAQKAASHLAAGPSTANATASPQIVTGGPQPCSSASQVQGQPFAYTPDVLATAYGFSPLYLAGDQGAGQTVALFEQQPYQPSDIATFQACMGTAAAVSPVDVDGGPGPYTPPDGHGGGGDGESALDIEVVTGLAPKASVLVYQGPPTATAPVDILTAIITQNRAKVISSSWGACEASTPGAQITAENTLLQEAAAQGQSFFISSGDSGAEQCSQLGHGDTSLSVLDPAGQPFATGVGGTTLFSGTGDAYTGGVPTEGVWNDGPNGNGGGSGSGGGLSKQWPMPAYQSTAAGSLGVINSSSSGAPCGATFCREVPDVSADADLQTGYIMFVEGQWTVIGGTSAAAPLWAAFTGLANASPACRGTSIGFANPSLYAIAGSSYLNNFHDVSLASPVTGAANNDVLNGTGPFPTTGNYDMTTGIGTPIGGTLAASLCGRASPVYAVGVVNPGTLGGTVGTPLAAQITGSDAGGAPLTYTATGLPAGLAINPANGVVSGTPAAAGTSIVTVAATDPYTNASSTQFAWTILTPPPPKPKAGPAKATHLSLSGVAKRRPRLSFSIAAGLHAAKVKTVAVTLPKGLAFSKSKKSLAKGITIKSGKNKKLKFKLTVKKNVATLTLASSVSAAKFALAYPAVTVTAKEASSVRHHKVKTLKFSVSATDASRHKTVLSLKPKAK